ncbi:hypothetical protein [Streptomyces albus]|uniref:hypothetical protein n=1 Tax=Streptomyces albus TaxID=1888 RepID=UPI0004CB3711|nr:hypothetical protein [Streptomyces albus]
MQQKEFSLPSCALDLFDPRFTYLTLLPRMERDWATDIVTALAPDSSTPPDRETRRPPAEISSVSGTTLHGNLWKISRLGAADLLKIIAVGSLLGGLDASAFTPDNRRDDCIQQLLRDFSEDDLYLTNHGHAEDGDEESLLSRTFHFSAMTSSLLDVALVAISSSRILVAWRFEQD